MNDEKYVFITDCAEKKRTARGIHNKRTHAGKGGKVIFPSDYLTRKEREAMNGEVKTYALNCPMRWKAYKSMPQEIQTEYFRALVEKHGGTQQKLSMMFGVSSETVRLEARKFNVKFGRYHNPDICAERCLAWEAFLNQENVPMVEAVETFPKTSVDPPEEVKASTTMPLQNRVGAPKSGSLCFENTTTTEALNLVYSVLGSVSMAKLSVSWEV